MSTENICEGCKYYCYAAKDFYYCEKTCEPIYSVQKLCAFFMSKKADGSKPKNSKKEH